MRYREKEMNEKFGDRATLRHYHLGTLNDDVLRSEIEKKLITDDGFAGVVSVAENDLIEEYLDGNLSTEDAERFIRHFLISPERKLELRLTENLRKLAAKSAILPLARRGRFDWVYLLLRPRFAVFALVIAAAILGIWRFAIYSTDADRGLAEFRSAYRGQRPIEPRVTALPDYAPFSETRGPQAPAIDPAMRERAERYLLDAARDPADARAHHALALLYLTEKKYDRSLQEFDLALKASPKNKALESDAGAAYLEIARNTDGEKNGAKILELLNEGLKHLDLAIAIDAKMPEPRFNRALCLQALQNPEQAKEAWSEYLEIDPTSKWADEARRNLERLEAAPAGEVSAEELESDFLKTVRAGDETKAGELISENRELIRKKYLPQRLAMSYVRAPDDRRGEQLRALQAAGNIEMKITGDPFANGIAHFYSTLAINRIGPLLKAEEDIERGYQLCLASEYGPALDAFRSANRAFKDAGDIWEESLSRYFIGYALINLNRPEDGLRELTPVVEFANVHGFLWLEATAEHWIAGVYAQMKKHTEAKRSYEHALSIAEKIKDPYAIQRNLLQLARMSSFCGQKKTALNYLFRTLPQSNRPGNSLRQKYRNLSLALEILTAAKLYNAAKPFALEAVSVAGVVGDPMWLTEAPSAAAAALTETAEFDRARDLMDRGMGNAAAVSDNKTRQNMLAYSQLKFGDLERRLGNYDASVRYYTDAVNYYDTVSFPYDREQAHEGLMLALFASGRNDELESQIPANIKLTEEFRQQVADEQERTGYFDLRENVYDIATDFEHRRGNFERAYDYAEASSSRSLLDTLQDTAAVDGSQKSRELTTGDLIKPLGLAGIREKMPAGSQIVQYSVLDDKILVWVVSREAFSVHAVAIDSSVLQSKVERFSGMLSTVSGQAGTARNELGRELYDILIAPVRNELDPNAEICLVPSKVLFSLPFAALASPDGKPLISEFAIVYAPSANIFLHCSDHAEKKTFAKSEKLLGVGNPGFDRSKFDDLPDLPEAETEVLRITADYGDAQVLTGKGATKTAFLNAAQEADVIHFAGHYVAAPESPQRSYVLLARNGSKPEDSMLTNLELTGMKFPHARLIVLAACQTGYEGTYSGEGVMGLSRTFLAAGVPLVVASEWSVDREATAALMTRFHFFRRQERLTTTAALRRAQLEMANDPDGRFNEPYYWAAFAVFGGHADF